ncbi:carbohydrate ABC transporter permease [Agromyces atrinae]|uniref:N,N'-diacetylchitobiose transport system permease protein n=1 Tax=Agromyces atrinae TaxID=592376 RepID=A0A4Q2MBP8_9MICO|nr:sugar ABC transporter permease [Agromyces atrinae]NYD66786.1 N,N'-diacetylchitobiose transport system permease protein [Agromyces atrinae]RXZ87442.1 sugar ABC transporter permease [Agromyces atrinae]
MTTPVTGQAPAPSAVEGERLLAPEPAPKSRQRRRRGGFTPYALLIPSIVTLAAIVGWPLVQLIITSFQTFGRAQVFGAPPEFIGFANYTKVLSDPAFWQVLGRTILFAAACVIITMVLGTLIALMMTRLNKFFRGLLAVGLLLAWAMPALTATIVWGWVFDTDYGIVNHILVNLFSLDEFQQHSWLINPLSFFFVAGIIIVWGAVPFVAFTLYAGLTQVPDEVLEAAQLDGAGGVKRFRFVIFPYLKPIFLVTTILQIIWDLRVFTQIFALQDIGGIREQTNTLGVYIYQVSIAGGEFGLGGAIAVITVIILMVISLYYVRQNIKQEDL